MIGVFIFSEMEAEMRNVLFLLVLIVIFDVVSCGGEEDFDCSSGVVFATKGELVKNCSSGLIWTKKAVSGKPGTLDEYWYKFIKLPKTDDKNIFVFEAAVVLQMLALKMSIAKMKYLNRSKIESHGVHPDVPKNVSKSITVD